MTDNTKIISSVIGTGIAVAALLLSIISDFREDIRHDITAVRTDLHSLSGRVDSLSDRVDTLSDRVSRVEGLVQGMLSSSNAPTVAQATGDAPAEGAAPDN